MSDTAAGDFAGVDGAAVGSGNQLVTIHHPGGETSASMIGILMQLSSEVGEMRGETRRTSEKTGSVSTEIH